MPFAAVIKSDTPQRPEPAPWLEPLRRFASTGRLAPRCNLDGVCACIRAGQPPSTEALVAALLRALSIGLGRAVVIHRPGSLTLSFDESWLIRVIDSIQGEDWDSLAFNLTARLSPPERMKVRFLAGVLARRIDNLETNAGCIASPSRCQPAGQLTRKG
ncbi:MAG: hypothetical protein ACFBRM_01915 [Pikeienuella sp.]